MSTSPGSVFQMVLVHNSVKSVHNLNYTAECIKFVPYLPVTKNHR